MIASAIIIMNLSSVNIYFTFESISTLPVNGMSHYAFCYLGSPYYQEVVVKSFFGLHDKFVMKLMFILNLRFLLYSNQALIAGFSLSY